MENLFLSDGLICRLATWHTYSNLMVIDFIEHKKVQVGKDQEKAQSEKDSHSKNRGGKKPN